jgi:hypothetical protein
LEFIPSNLRGFGSIFDLEFIPTNHRGLSAFLNLEIIPIYFRTIGLAYFFNFNQFKYSNK